MEINPNHPTTKLLADSWHKLCALLMCKLGSKHVVITKDEVDALGHGQLAIVIQELSDGIHLRLTSLADGEAIAKLENERN